MNVGGREKDTIRVIHDRFTWKQYNSKKSGVLVPRYRLTDSLKAAPFRVNIFGDLRRSEVDFQL